MNYAKETKSSLIDILKYRDSEIKEFQSLYVNNDINSRDLKEKQQVLIYLLIVTFTIGVLFYIATFFLFIIIYTFNHNRRCYYSPPI